MIKVVLDLETETGLKDHEKLDQNFRTASSDHAVSEQQGHLSQSRDSILDKHYETTLRISVRRQFRHAIP